ncbi:MAG TPA: PfkB family carbohydrate kinase [Ktedonobacteraceae bacterium]
MMNQPISPVELVQGFRHLRALVVGDVMLDTYLEGTATRLCSEGPIPVVAKTAEYRLPGGAANTAANLRALGADVALLGAIGPDLAGSLLRETLRTYAISDEWLIEDTTITTQHKIRIMADRQYVVRFDEGGTRENCTGLSVPGQQRLQAIFNNLYHQYDLIVISDYGYGVASRSFIDYLRLFQDKEPKILLIDSKALQYFRHIRATLVTPNYKEANELIQRMQKPSQTVSSLDRTTGSTVEYIGQSMLSLLRAEHVAVTLGDQGVSLFGRGETTRRIAASPIASLNDVGAGDSFTAAVALALAAKGSLEEAIKIGNDAAGIAVSQQRTTVVPYQELLQRVSVREYAQGKPGTTEGAAGTDFSLLITRLRDERLRGKTIVFTNGIFDILHAGHIYFLRQAKALGDILVVGINSDQSIQRLKGWGHPINSARDRKALVEALDMVDAVTFFDEDTPTELIRALRPDIHAKGGDYVNESLPEAEAVQAYGGRVVILPLAGSVQSDTIRKGVLAVAKEGTPNNPLPAVQDAHVTSAQISPIRGKYDR